MLVVTGFECGPRHLSVGLCVLCIRSDKLDKDWIVFVTVILFLSNANEKSVPIGNFRKF